ncbi:MAG: hypothetical protein ABIR58_00105 [Gemmatimonadaceae bacterium]
MTRVPGRGSWRNVQQPTPVLLYLNSRRWRARRSPSPFQSHLASEERHKAQPDPDYPGKYMIHNGVLLLADVQRVLAREDLRAVVGHFCLGFHRYLRKP